MIASTAKVGYCLKTKTPAKKKLTNHNILGVCLRVHMLMENMLHCIIFLYFALSTLTEHKHRVSRPKSNCS